MSDREDLYTALRNADAAGDTEAATKLATYIKTLPAEEAPAKKAAEAPKAEPPKKSFGEKFMDTAAGKMNPVAMMGSELLHPGTMAKSAYLGGKQMLNGMSQLASRAVYDPLDRVVGKMTGKDPEPDIASRHKTMDEAVVNTAKAQEENAKGAPAAAMMGSMLPMALAGPASPELAGAGALGRIASPAIGGGAVSAMQPVADSSESASDFAKEKGAQFGLGAGLGAAGAALGEVGSAVKGFVNKHVLFGDVGTASSPIQKLWDKAAKMGFNVSFQQARQDAGRVQTPGITYAQREQNRLAANVNSSAAVGDRAGVIDKEYLGRNRDRLGASYDAVYGPGTTFKVDGGSISQLQEFLTQSSAAQLGYPWANREAMAAASRLVEYYQAVAGSAGVGSNIKMNVEGPTLNRLLSELKSSSAKLRDPFQREDLNDVISSINDSVSRNNPTARAALNVLNPQYRTLSTLETLSRSGGVDANGNVSPEAVAKLLRRTDRGYSHNASTHPLRDLAEVGETFGIRGIGAPEITGGQSSRGTDLPTSRAGFLQRGVEAAKEHNFGFAQRGFERYKMGESGHGLDRSEQKTVADIAAVAKMEEDKRENPNR